MKLTGIENPDEMTDVGQTIDFTVKELPKPEPWYKKLKWWVWAIAGGVLLLIIGLILFFTLVPRTPDVFNATSLTDTSFANPPIPTVDLGTFPAVVLIKAPTSTTLIPLAVIQPDVSLPFDRVSIQNVTLHLRVVNQGPDPNPLRITASRATSAWNESPGSPTPTCDTQQVTTVPIAVGSTEVDIDITAIYKKLRAAGANNFGICLTSPDTQYVIFFPSREFTTVEMRPVITVNYKH
jgi:hypothetical protein